jgi:hypothetical protein
MPQFPFFFLDFTTIHNVPSLPSLNWTGVAAAATTTFFAAGADGFGHNGAVWTSTDSGVHWTSMNSPNEPWTSIASSADGSTIVAVGSGSQIWTYSLVSAAPAPPSASTSNATSVTTSSATLNGLAAADNAETTAWIQWGTTTNYGNIAALQDLGTAPTPVAISASVTGLTLGTTYHFRVIATNAFNALGLPFGQAVGMDQTFTTLGGAPSATTLAADQLTSTSARLNGSATANYLPTTVRFEWGTTTGYGNVFAVQSIGSGASPVAVSGNLGGLTLAGTYHYRLVATNSIGTNFGGDVVFTLPLPFTNSFALTLPWDSIIPTSGNSPGGQGVRNAIDAAADSKYLNLDILNTGFTVFPTYAGAPAQAITLISAEDAPERDPASFLLQGSGDGSHFTTVASNAVPPFPTRHAIQSFTFTNGNAYPIYRVIFPTVQGPAANAMQIAEVELLPYGEITSPRDTINLLSLPGGAFLTPGSTPGALLDRMLDQPTNKLVVVNDSGVITMLITPAAGISILKGFEIIGGYDDISFPGRTPSFVLLEGSADGSTFIPLSSVTPIAPTANMQIQGFALLGNVNSYTQYRVTFGVPQSGSVLQLGELRLFGINPPVAVSPPVAATMTVQRTAGLSTMIALSNLATNWSDPNGYAVVLTGIKLMTTNGVTLATNSAWILYPNGPNVNDQFSYSIADTGGATNIGYVNVLIVPSVTGTNSIVSVFAGNPTTLTAYGIPGYSYVTQRATNLATPVWVNIATNTAAANGMISVTDNFSDLGGSPPPEAYYRLSWSP